MTCTNGEGSGVVVPGTGIHVNNIMGEEDLNPLGFLAFPPGRRMPSMMAPDGRARRRRRVELVLGSAGSNRIRSAILQTSSASSTTGWAPRTRSTRRGCTSRTASSTPSPASTGRRLGAADAVAPSASRNLFFGGVQAIEHDRATGAVSGAGDPRRGGASAFA